MRGTAADVYELMLASNSSTQVRSSSDSSTKVRRNNSTRVRSSRNNVRKVFLLQGLLVGVRHAPNKLYSSSIQGFTA